MIVMKRTVKNLLPLMLVALVSVMAAFTADAARRPAKKPAKVYYLVCGSYSSLEKAKEASEFMSEVLYYPVYKTTVNGKTVYRLCCECYYSKKKAQARAKELMGMVFNDSIWVWESNGLANCVYVPQSPADEPGVEGQPLVPIR